MGNNFSEVGRIGSEVRPKTVKVGDANVLVVEVPVFFNSFVPGVGNTSFEVYATMWREKAEWISEQAAKQERDGVKTNGKGMLMDFVGRLYTHKYTNAEGKEVKTPKLAVLEVTYPQNIGGNGANSNANRQTNPSSGSAAPAADKPVETKKEQPAASAPTEEFNLPEESNKDFLSDFDAFIAEIGGEDQAS